MIPPARHLRAIKPGRVRPARFAGMEEKENSDATPYALVGGAEGLNRIVTRFYALMEASPDFAAIRKLHAADLSHARVMLFEFLSGWLGGPPLYFQRPERRCVMSAHRRFPIGSREVTQWLSCMHRALTECGVEEPLRARIGAALARLAEGMRNRAA
jgi:hemoglobin